MRVIEPGSSLWLELQYPKEDPVANLNDLVGYQRKRIKELEAQAAELTKKKPAPSEGGGPRVNKNDPCYCYFCGR